MSCYPSICGIHITSFYFINTYFRTIYIILSINILYNATTYLRMRLIEQKLPTLTTIPKGNACGNIVSTNFPCTITKTRLFIFPDSGAYKSRRRIFMGTAGLQQRIHQKLFFRLSSMSCFFLPRYRALSLFLDSKKRKIFNNLREKLSIIKACKGNGIAK